LVSFFALSQKKEKTGNNSTSLRKCIGYVCFCDGRYYLHNAPKSTQTGEDKEAPNETEAGGRCAFQ